METINNIELCNESIYPDESVLMTVLDESFYSYNALLELFAKHEMDYEWRYYHDGKAWLCKVQKKKKTIVWMSAWKGYMQATLYIPEKHLDRVYELDISSEMKEVFRSTKNVGKSKPCIFKITDNSILAYFETVMLFKIAIK